MAKRRNTELEQKVEQARSDAMLGVDAVMEAMRKSLLADGMKRTDVMDACNRLRSEITFTLVAERERY